MHYKVNLSKYYPRLSKMHKEYQQADPRLKTHLIIPIVYLKGLNHETRLIIKGNCLTLEFQDYANLENYFLLNLQKAEMLSNEINKTKELFNRQERSKKYKQKTNENSA